MINAVERSGSTVKLNARQGRDLAHCAPERET